ncbi:MAG: formate dehydrogenase subunit alpha [Actinobacteria bacterium]|nr:formate dehydrogenase subunit alpha [Actinomycetota bacterium]
MIKSEKTTKLSEENKTLNITINGEAYQASPQKTILETAIENNIFIPNLCYDPRLKPQGACRLCLVEIEGMSEAVASCVTRVADGMKITTNSSHVDELVRLNLELIISDHPLDCMTCESCGNCTLQDLAYKYNIKETALKGERHEKKILEDNPFIYRDNEKCILCGRCIRMCDNVIGANAIGYAGRGFECEVVPAFDKSLKETDCVFCGNCVSTCPVGALQEKPYLKNSRFWEITIVKTVCPYCGVGCTINLHMKDGRIVRVSSDIGKNVNQGNLCVKGRFGIIDFVNSDKRLTAPLIKTNDGGFKEISWTDSINFVADKLLDIKQKHGADSIALLSSAKCTNEENFLFSKFARAGIGTNNIDHCARLCHASTVTGLVKTFGSGAMTNSVDDIRYSDAAIIIGSNTTEAHPVIGYEITRCVIENGLKLIVIDPREIPITKYASIHLKQYPGTDIAVLLGIMNVIYNNNLQDNEFIENRTEGFDELIKIFNSYTPKKVEEISGVDKNKLIEAAKIYGSAKNASIFYSMGITQHSCGTNNVSTVANLAMMTGNIGRKGAGVNPLRGQNNVQGSCDMGALPDYLSGYKIVEDNSERQRFEKKWGKVLPSGTGLTVTEIIEGASSGKIKALYIMGENPMLSDPDILHVAKALKNLEFIVVQDIFLTETGEFADVVLPGACFAEKDGTFTNTERRVQRVRKALNPPGQAKEDWKIICMMSEAMGYTMKYNNTGEIMDEIAELTPIYGGISYERLESGALQWPCNNQTDNGTKILHIDKFTRGKGRFIPAEYSPPVENPDKKYPFILTTGRLLYQFHTRTMTGKVKGLNEIAPMNIAHINTEDAKKLNINSGDRIILESRRGSIISDVIVNSKIKEGVVFIPFHFADSPANRLTNPVVDPKAKIPEFKACAVRVTKVV